VTDGWSRPFDDPILLPRGRQLLTLKDAADYIMKLAKAEQNLEEWQTATEAPGCRRPGPADACPDWRAASATSE
jgi:hypothetical protein